MPCGIFLVKHGSDATAFVRVLHTLQVFAGFLPALPCLRKMHFEGHSRVSESARKSRFGLEAVAWSPGGKLQQEAKLMGPSFPARNRGPLACQLGSRQGSWIMFSTPHSVDGSIPTIFVPSRRRSTDILTTDAAIEAL